MNEAMAAELRKLCEDIVQQLVPDLEDDLGT